MAFRDAASSWAIRREHYRGLIERERAFVLRAETSEGASLGYLLGWMHAPGALEIETLALLPGARGRGLGARLLDEARSVARAEHAAHRIDLEVMVGNDDAERFYRREGFIPGAHTLMRTDDALRDAVLGDVSAAEGLLAGASRRLSVALSPGPDDTWISSDPIMRLGLADVDEPGLRELDAQLGAAARAGVWTVMLRLAELTPAVHSQLEHRGFQPILRTMSRALT